MKYLFLSLFLLVNFAFGFDSIEVSNPHIILHKSGYFKTDKNLTSNQAYKIFKEGNFTTLPKNAISFGFDHDSYWFLFEISNTSDEQYYLDSRDLLSQYQDFYIYKNDQLVSHNKSGFYVPSDQKSINTFSSRFKLEKNSNNTVYLLKIDTTLMRLTSFAIGNEKEVEKTWTYLLVIFVAISAVAFSFILYNLSLYYFTKDKSYLYYTIYIFGVFSANQLTSGYIPFLLGLSGETSMVFWIFSIILIDYGCVYFTIYFLNLEKNDQQIKTIIFILLAINIFFTPFHIYSNIIPYSQTLWLLSLEVLQLMIIVIGIKRYIDGFKPALFFVIATGGGILFSFVFLLMNQNFGVPYSLLSVNFSNIALVWDSILLSTALAYRIKLLKEENFNYERLVIMKSRQKVIGELTGNIAHQWRQPLNTLGAIIANVEAKIKYDHLSEKELMESCKLSTSVLQHLSGTINTLQDFFVDQTEKKEDFNLNELIENLIHFLNDSLSNHHISIDFNFQKTLFIHSNRNLLSQVIMNILLNAKDILIKRNGNKNRLITITTSAEDEKVVITINDNGGGITIEPIEKIFELFISSKTDGSGIGLYLSKNIIEKLGGILNASNTSEGAEFLIILPIQH